MKGLILAGGFATRLRPLSCSKPKLLFPIVGVPLIDLMIRWLRQGEVREAILAVSHLSDRLRMEVGEKRLGSKIVYSVEETPLGTAGPIRLAKGLLDQDEPFVVVNGDIVSDINLKEMLKAHARSRVQATTALVSVSDPTPYGSVTVDSKGRITKFEEKSQNRPKSNLVNAGIYVLDPNLIDLIPDSGPVSLERRVFPKLAQKGKMQGWRHHGYWYDIGRIRDYVRANRELLRRSGSTGLQGRTETRRSGMVRHPSHVGKGSRLGVDVRLGPYAILSDRVVVKSGSVIRDSIIFEETIIGERCRVEGALVGERVVLGRGTSVGKGSVVAGEISLPEGSVIDPNSVILTS